MDKYSFSVACDEAENDFYRVVLVSEKDREKGCTVVEVRTGRTSFLPN